MITTILQFALLTFIAVYKAIHEAYKDKEEKDKVLKESNYTKSIEHKQSALKRGLLFTASSLLIVLYNFFFTKELHYFGSVLFFSSVFYQLSVFFILFDSTLNYLDKKSLYYIGNTADTDQKMIKYFGEDGYLYFQVKLLILSLTTLFSLFVLYRQYLS